MTLNFQILRYNIYHLWRSVCSTLLPMAYGLIRKLWHAFCLSTMWLWVPDYLIFWPQICCVSYSQQRWLFYQYRLSTVSSFVSYGRGEHQTDTCVMQSHLLQAGLHCIIVFTNHRLLADLQCWSACWHEASEFSARLRWIVSLVQCDLAWHSGGCRYPSPTTNSTLQTTHPLTDKQRKY